MGVLSLQNDMLSGTLHKENAVSGNVISFNTNAIAPLDFISVNMITNQETNGFDPYPPGGSNNLIPDGTDTSNGYVAGYYLKYNSSTGEETLTSSTFYSISEYFPITAEETYTLSFNMGLPTAPSICFYDSSKNLISGVAYNSTSPQTVVTPAGSAYCRASYYGFYDTSETPYHGVQFELGATATTIMPYTHLCPFNGYAKVKLFNDPVHDRTIYWKQMIKNGNISNGTTYWSAYSTSYDSLSVSDGKLTDSVKAINGAKIFGMKQGSLRLYGGQKYLITFYIKRKLSRVASGNMTSYFLYVGDQQIGSSISLSEVDSTKRIFTIFTLTGSQTNICIRKSSFTPVEVGDEIFQIWDVMLLNLSEMFGNGNEPDAETLRQMFPDDYYSYNAGEITTISAVNDNLNRQVEVSWSDSVGTIYGGILTINKDGTGTLVSDRKLVTITGGAMAVAKTYARVKLGEYMQEFYYDDDTLPKTHVKTNMLKIGTSYKLSSKYTYYPYRSTSGISGDYIYIKVDDTTYSSTAGAKNAANAWLAAMNAAGTPLQVCYRVLTPTTYTLSAEEVRRVFKTLNGQNNIMSDAPDPLPSDPITPYKIRLQYWKH